MKGAYAIFTGLIGFAGIAAAPDPTRAEMIDQLASESYAERVEATNQLWAEGEGALDALREAARSRDPEMALRARGLLRKIDLGITPETDPEIIELVEKYPSANLNRKNTIFNDLRRRKAWRQIMRLYANESDPSTRENFASMVDGIALHAARERIVQGDDQGAMAFLEMARETDDTLVSIAALHRARGSLDAQLTQAATPATPGEFRWLAALQRVAGDPAAAAASARAAGDNKLAAAMAMLTGDPLPWLDHHADPGAVDDSQTNDYAHTAAMRWRGEDIIVELESIRRQLHFNDETTRTRAQASLFLLGAVEPAWKAVEIQAPDEAFVFYDALERVDDALRLLGIDPAEPDFSGYLPPLLASACAPPGNRADFEDDHATATHKLVAICSFLENRGRRDVLDALVLPKLIEFGEVHHPRFTDLMAELFAAPAMPFGAPELASRAAIRWAGDDADRWQEIMIAAFGEEQGFQDWWLLTAELDPQATRADRLRGVLAIFGYTRDAGNRYEHWLDLAWKKLNEADKPAESPVFHAMDFLMKNMTDLRLIERFNQLDVERGGESETTYGSLLVDTASGRWDDVAEMFLGQIATLAERNEARAELHAYAAASLRRAGREDEAVAHEAWVESLILGDSRANLAVAQAYSFGRDYARSAKWYRRALLEGEPQGNIFSQALRGYLNELLESRDHDLAASCAEAVAVLEAVDSGIGKLPSTFTRLRQQADFARALSLPRARDGEARRLLRGAHAISPTDGALADYFFPALVQSRFIGLHDELFEISWKKITASLTHFPEADNTMNTAGWFAGRGVRRLDKALELQQRALVKDSRNPAYLDTLAEIHFAMGNRPEAIRLGEAAVRFMPHDAMIIRQFERFRHGEMPAQ